MVSTPKIWTVWGVYKGEADEVIRKVRAHSDMAACAVANSLVHEHDRYFDGVAPVAAYVVSEGGTEVYRVTQHSASHSGRRKGL